MSGRIHGEVLDVVRRLREHGLSRNAVDALTVIAEGCRDETRIGPCSRARIADKIFRTERTASRAVEELTDAGLVHVVAAGGGRGREGVVSTYRIVELRRWLADREDTDRRDIGDPGDIQMSPGSCLADGSARHSDVPPIVPPMNRNNDPCDISSPSAGHPDVTLPVVLPVKESCGPVLEVTTGARGNAYAPPPPPPRCPRHCDIPDDWVAEDCHDCALVRRAHLARHTDLARGEARARRACTECNRYGLMLGFDGELLDIRCAHPTVPDEVWSGEDPAAPPKPPPVEAPPERGGRHRLREELPDNVLPPVPAPRPPAYRPSPRPREPEGATSS